MKTILFIGFFSKAKILNFFSEKDFCVNFISFSDKFSYDSFIGVDYFFIDYSNFWPLRHKFICHIKSNYSVRVYACLYDFYTNASLIKPPLIDHFFYLPLDLEKVFELIDIDI